MFGIGKLLGKVVGGVLEKVGLGSIAPFVKLGLSPPLGNFAATPRPSARSNDSVNERLDNLIEQLTQLNAGNNPATLAMFETVRSSFTDTVTASNSFSRAYYSQIRS
jgi:hypothetical protein